MTRSYRNIRPKTHHVYSIAELTVLYDVCPNTVSNWIADGLRPSDDAIPKLFRGAVVRRFHEEMRLRRRVYLRPDEALCCKCKRGVIPVSPRPLGKASGADPRLQSGTCPYCGTRTTKIQTATDCDTDRDCRNPKTTPDREHEEVDLVPGSIGSESGSDTADLHLANDRTLHAWLGYAGRYSDKTVDSHIAAIRYFEGLTGGKPFEMLTREDVAGVRDELKRHAAADAADPLSASTIRHRQSHLVAFLDWLRKQDGFRRLPRDLVDYLELPRAATASALREAPREYPSIAEAADLLDAMPKTSLPDRRARALFAVAFLGGLRADTIASLRVGDIDVENRRIRQDGRRARTKAGKSLEIAWFPIPDAFGTAVTDWIGTLRRFGFTPKDALFPKTEHLKHRFPKPGSAPVPAPRSTNAVTAAFALASRSGTRTYTPHAAKHTIAAERDARPLTRLQRKAWSENMGHESEQTTETYYGKLKEGQRIELIEEIKGATNLRAPEMSDAEKIALVDLLFQSLTVRPDRCPENLDLPYRPTQSDKPV